MAVPSTRTVSRPGAVFSNPESAALNSAGAARDAAMRGHGVCTVLSDQRHIRVASKQELKDRIMAAMDEFNRHPVVHTFL